MALTPSHGAHLEEKNKKIFFSLYWNLSETTNRHYPLLEVKLMRFWTLQSQKRAQG
jgi:hypothetical protein